MGELEGLVAVSWGPDRIDLFWVGEDRALMHRSLDGSAWSADESLGGELTGTPAVSSSGADRIDVFAAGRDGRLWHRWWNGSEWVSWRQEPDS